MKKILSILCAALLAVSLTACGSSQEIENDTEANTAQEQVIYDDDTLKAVYKGISETSGVVVMTVELTNKTDNEISVLPMDSSVDGTMVQFTSGTIATIQGGKTFNQGWIIGTVPEEKVEFSMSICDKDMSEIVKTSILTIEVE